MSDRPRSGGPEDEPEFTWLYGQDDPDAHPGATRPVPQQRRSPQRTPRPDETRVMRTQPRERGRPTPREGTRPVPPPLAPAPAPGRTGRRRPRFRARYIGLLLLAYLVFLVAVPFIAWNQVEKSDWEPDGERPADQPGTTYLLVGSDSRADLTARERRDLSTGNPAGQRTDTIMLLHTGSGPNLLMSIPRDLEVDIPGNGTTKVNAAYAFGGPRLLVQTIEGTTGIRVDDYVEIGMGGVVGVVDAVGGVEICPDARMRDPLAGLNVRKGCQEADGEVALAYARSRKTAALGDLDRARRQREVVSAVGGKVLSPWTVVNPVRWWRLNNAIPDFFEFGEGTSPVRAGLWAMAMTRVDGDAGLTCGLPLRPASSLVDIDADRSEQLFTKIIQDDTASVGPSLCTPTGIPR